MVALSASRLVCSAIAVISFTTSPMRPAAFDSAPMRVSVRSACFTASPAIRLEFLHLPGDLVAPRMSALRWREATDCTLAEASSEAVATMPESCWVVSAVWVSVPAALSSSAGARRHRVDDIADRALERVGELMHRGLALVGGLALLSAPSAGRRERASARRRRAQGRHAPARRRVPGRGRRHRRHGVVGLDRARSGRRHADQDRRESRSSSPAPSRRPPSRRPPMCSRSPRPPRR